MVLRNRDDANKSDEEFRAFREEMGVDNEVMLLFPRKNNACLLETIIAGDDDNGDITDILDKAPTAARAFIRVTELEASINNKDAILSIDSHTRRDPHYLSNRLPILTYL